MVESFIQEHSGEYKKRALWENLPRKMMSQTYSVIIGYLLDPGRLPPIKTGKSAGSLIRKFLGAISITVI